MEHLWIDCLAPSSDVFGRDSLKISQFARFVKQVLRKEDKQTKTFHSCQVNYVIFYGIDTISSLFFFFSPLKCSPKAIVFVKHGNAQYMQMFYKSPTQVFMYFYL